MSSARSHYYQLLFRSAALFNTLIALGFIFAYSTILQLLAIPVPANPIFLQLFAVLVMLFGLAYYWISLNPTIERSLILLGAIGKSSVFITTTLLYFWLGTISWQLPTLASVDLLYALTFIECLRFQRRSHD